MIIAPKSDITTLYEGLLKAPELKGVRVTLGAKKLSANAAPPLIRIYPTAGKIGNPKNRSLFNRDVERALIAHIWGTTFDEVCYLQTLLVQALVNQGAGGDPLSGSGATPGIYWMATEEEWEYSEDASRQGEELYMLVSVVNSLAKVTGSTGTVSSVSLTQLTTTLSAPMGTTETTATVASTANFPSMGVLTIDSETILYTSTTATQFAGLVRGVNNTTVATHSQGATVTPTS